MRFKKLFYTSAAALVVSSTVIPGAARAQHATPARTQASATAGASALPSGASAQSSAVTPHIGIDNFAMVNTTYYRGAQPEGSDYADLAALGVRTVIDLQEDGDSDESRFVEQAGMTYHRIPMTTRVEPTREQLEEFLALVNDPANQPVYVHCAGGRHRTGVMTAVYRMTRDGLTGDQAFKEMKQYKYGADFLHPEFKRFVYAYRAPAAPAAASEAVVANAGN